MARFIVWLGLFLLVAADVFSQAEHDPIPQPCVAADEFIRPDEPLEHVAAAITRGGPVNLLAVGSATTVGDQVGVSPETSFPMRMLAALRAAMPRISFKMTVRGGRGLTAEDMVPLINSAFAEQHYHLVVWQTGTVEAVRGLRPDAMQAALQTGIERAQQAGADIVLVDPQFSRFLRANADLDPYEATLEQTAATPGVVLFRRFELMHDWADDGRVDLERASKADRPHTLAMLNACLGKALAQFILNGAGVQQH